MKRIGLYLTIVIILMIILSIPLVMGLYIGSLVSKILFGFTVLKG